MFFSNDTRTKAGSAARERARSNHVSRKLFRGSGFTLLNLDALKVVQVVWLYYRAVCASVSPSRTSYRNGDLRARVKTTCGERGGEWGGIERCTMDGDCAML